MMIPDLDVGDAGAVDHESCRADQLRIGIEARAEEKQHAVLEGERHAERGDEDGERRRREQRLVGEPFDHHADAAGERHCDEQGDEDTEAPRHVGGRQGGQHRPTKEGRRP